MKDLQMKWRGVSKLQGEHPGKELSLVLGTLNEVTVGLPTRGVIQTLRSKRPCTEGKMSTEKELMELSAEGGESWEMDGRAEAGT